MKKIFDKKTIFSFVLGIILCSGIVYGANVYHSSSIEYSPTDSSWEVKNVNDALNSLYSMKTELDNLKGIGDATADQILSGKTALVQGSTITGTMIDRGAVTSTLNAGGSYTIPAGYHNGGGKVTANSLASQTSATATAANIASGKTAWVNGTKITGTGIMGGNYNIVVQLYIQNQNSDEYKSNQQNYTIQIRNGKIVSSTTLGGIWAHSGDVSWSSAQAQLRIISITAV